MLDPRISILAIALATPCPNQDTPQRLFLAGRVVDRSGDPLPGATVTLVGNVLSWTDALGSADVVNARADNRGRFRARVLPTIGYSAWAVGGADTNGDHRVTAVAENIAAGHTITLREVDERAARLRMRLTGAEKWADRAPFTLRIVPNVRTALSIPVPLDADLEGDLPPLPGTNAMVHVVDRDGGVLQVTSVRLTRSSEKRRDSATATLEMIQLHDPVAISARVVGADGQPIAGALIRHRSSSKFLGSHRQRMIVHQPNETWYVAGKTGDDGMARLEVALTKDPFESERNWQRQLFVASAPGRAEANSGFDNNKLFWNGIHAPLDAQKELRFTLAQAEPLVGRIVEAPDVPFANREVLVSVTCKIKETEGSGGWSHLDRFYTVSTDASGRFSVPGLPRDAYGFEFGARVTPDLDRRWRQGETRLGTRPLLLSALSPVEARVLDTGTVDLSQTRDIGVQVFDVEQGPARQCYAILMSTTTDVGGVPDLAWEYHLDPSGRLVIRAQPGEYWLFVTDESGYAYQRVKVGDEHVAITATLEPIPTMRGVVSGPDGPVGGARISIRSSSVSFGGQRADQRLVSLFGRLNHRIIPTTSAADGTFTCRFFAHQNVAYQLLARKGKAASDPFAIEVTDDIVEIQIRD